MIIYINYGDIPDVNLRIIPREVIIEDIIDTLTVEGIYPLTSLTTGISDYITSIMNRPNEGIANIIREINFQDIIVDNRADYIVHYIDSLSLRDVNIIYSHLCSFVNEHTGINGIDSLESGTLYKDYMRLIF